MQTTLALVALAAMAYATPQGVTGDITPHAAAPAGCATTLSEKFQITAVNSTVARRDVVKRDLSKRDCPTTTGSLVISLAGGQLTDQKGRTGYIASNFQFQFDEPPQDGAIYTGGFSACSNGSLALGGSAIFYECLSGGFYNLYDRTWAAQCEPILIEILPCGGSSSAPPIGQSADGQPTGTTVVPAVISQISDGQPQAASAIPISQIADGQPQIPTAVISQISDGQIQNPTGIAISQISDGQPQAPVPTANPAPTQATTAAPVATQPSAGPVISQISDGQIQAPTAATAATTTQSTSTSKPFTGAGNVIDLGSRFAAAIAGAIALALL